MYQYWSRFFSFVCARGGDEKEKLLIFCIFVGKHLQQNHRIDCQLNDSAHDELKRGSANDEIHCFERVTSKPAQNQNDAESLGGVVLKVFIGLRYPQCSFN